MDSVQLNDLLDKYINGTITDSELKMLNDWYRKTAYQDGLYPDEEQVVQERMLNRLNDEIKVISLKKNKFSYGVIAASILICLGIYLYFYSNKVVSDNQLEVSKNDVAPGNNKAYITLDNGIKIDLSNSKTGVVINASHLEYTDGSVLKIGANLRQLMVSTPRGGTYQVVLPDSTKVWLNAASSLKFPSTFSGELNRKVQLSGEAYFEVTKLKNGGKYIPFIVESGSQEVEVLGTSFNVNAYPEGNVIKTSLLEGSVRVKNDKSYKLLKAGQQVISSEMGIEFVSGDAKDAIAWKHGYFIFENEHLEDIMTKICRWYNVNVSYEDEAVKKVRYYGTISRFENISKILNKLKLTGNLNFEVNDKTVYVTHKK